MNNPESVHNEMESAFRPVSNCRVCEGTSLTKYLDLGLMPLVNRYVRPEDAEKADPRFPLEIMYCNDCSLSQLSGVVDPKILYADYFYRSSVSKTFRNHCNRLAQYAIRNFDISHSDVVLDIASNDGATLAEFRKFDRRVIGVDPAKNLADIANEAGILTLPEFWSRETARKVVETVGQPKYVNAMNVFAHVDDVGGFLDGVREVLHPKGVFGVEFPYMLNFLHHTEFDTTYHEHLSYFLVRPLVDLFKAHGLEIFDVKQQMIHGGSIRLYAKHTSNKTEYTDNDSVAWCLDLEKTRGFHRVETYLQFSKDVNKIKEDLAGLLRELKRKGNRIAGYGASAKGTILTNYCGIGPETLDYILDDTPQKQGLLTPGQHIPIVNSQHFAKHPPDNLILLAWNFAEELMAKTTDFHDKGGHYIIPIPEVREV